MGRLVVCNAVVIPFIQREALLDFKLKFLFGAVNLMNIWDVIDTLNSSFKLH